MKNVGTSVLTTKEKLQQLSVKWENFKLSIFEKAKESGLLEDIDKITQDIVNNLTKEGVNKTIKDSLELFKLMVKFTGFLATNIKTIGTFLGVSFGIGVLNKLGKFTSGLWAAGKATGGLFVKGTTTPTLVQRLSKDGKRMELVTEQVKKAEGPLRKYITKLKSVWKWLGNIVAVAGPAAVGIGGVAAAVTGIWSEMSDDDKAKAAIGRLESYKKTLDSLRSQPAAKGRLDAIGVLYAQMSKEIKIIEAYEKRHKSKPKYSSTGAPTGGSTKFNVPELDKYKRLLTETFGVIKTMSKELPVDVVTVDKDKTEEVKTVIEDTYELQKAKLEYLIGLETKDSHKLFDLKEKLNNLIYDHEKKDANLLTENKRLALNKAYYKYDLKRREIDTTYWKWIKDKRKEDLVTPLKSKGVTKSKDPYAGWKKYSDDILTDSLDDYWKSLKTDAADPLTESLNNMAIAFGAISSAQNMMIEQTLAGWFSYLGQVLTMISVMIAAYKALEKAKDAATGIGFFGSLISGIVGIIAPLASSGKKGYETGGIVPGTSFSGDNVIAGLNSKEMILTTGQQAELFAMANGKGAGGGGVVEFEIRGDKLIGVLNNYNRKMGKIR